MEISDRGNLTARQAAVMNYILTCHRAGWIPTYREVCDDLGIASTNGVKGHTGLLVKKEWLRTIIDHAGFVLGPKALEEIERQNWNRYIP